MFKITRKNTENNTLCQKKTCKHKENKPVILGIISENKGKNL